MTRPLSTSALRRVLQFTLLQWRRQPLRVAATAGLTVSATLVDVLVPLAAGWLVDAITVENAPRTAWTALAMLLGLIALAMILRFGSLRLVVELTLAMMRDLMHGGFARVQRLPAEWHANAFAGSTVRQITRGAWGLDQLNDTLLLALLSSAVVLIGTTITLALFQPWLGLVALLGAIGFVAMTATLSVRWVAPAASLSNAQDSRVSGTIADALSCNAVVKSHAAETREDMILERVTAKWEHRTARTWRRAVSMEGAQSAVLWLLRTLVLGGAVAAWASGRATPGDVAFVLTAFAMLQGYLRSVGSDIRNLQRSVNDMEELVALLNEPVERDPARDPVVVQTPAIGHGAIRFRDVRYGYAGATTLLFDGLSVAIPAGQRVGLVGRSGSGKTTFVKLLQRMHELNGGRIELDGQDIAALPLGVLRQSLAVVPQEPILFHRTLAENIAYARPGVGEAAVRDAAERAGALEFIEALPKGFATLVGERGIKLSGGERQRVAIARAFLSDAPVLIMDEATSALDSESEAAVKEASERLMAGRTTLVIAHRLATVAGLDRLLVFDRGRMIEDGSHADLLRRPGGAYRALYERQSEAMAA